MLIHYQQSRRHLARALRDDLIALKSDVDDEDYAASLGS
jgi:hypothetical protein